MKRTLLILLLLATLLPVFAAGNSETIRTISVTGTGSITLIPNSVVVNTGIDNIDSDIGLALDANSTIMAGILEMLVSFGIKEENIQTSNYNVRYYKPYSKDQDLEEVYKVSNTIKITIDELDKLSDVLNSLIIKGANKINGVTFSVKDRDKYNDQLSLLALEDARSKVKLLADAEHMKIISVLSISESGVQIPATLLQLNRGSLAEGNIPMASGSENLSRSYNVTYQIEAK